MDLTRFYRMIRKSWVLLVALSLIGASVGAVVAFLTPAAYSSTVRLFVSFEASATAAPGDLVQANNYAVQKVFSYVDVVTTSAVLEPVIEQLKLDTTPEELAPDITASVPLNSVVIAITASAANPQDAAVLATATADSFTDYVVNTLESPIGGGPGPVKATVLQPAVAPDQPSSPSTITNIVLGGFIGLFTGLVVCFILAMRDKRVHTRRELATLGVDYLAGVPESPRNAGPHYVALRDAPASAEAEAFRRLRTKLSLTGDDPSSTVGVMSSIGGEGASTVAANLALAFAEGGASVAIIDADVRYGRQSDLLGIPAVAPAEAIDRAHRGQPVVVDLSQDSVTGNLSQAAFEDLLETLNLRFDVVVVDAPPVLQTDDAMVVADAVDRTLLVTSSGRVNITEVGAALDALRGIGKGVHGVVLTRLPGKGMDADPAVSVPFLHRETV
jgi:capsular polysaccharide biosynthesis protein/Mrp family chromosome partitioning ATPase